jgi:3'-phosphoadenosine 5'-phosphosulfate sulfotransferase
MAVSALLFQLISNPTITNVGVRVFPMVIPLGQRDKYLDAECAITYQMIDNQPNGDKHAASKVDNVRVQLVCYGNKYSECETVMAAVRLRIDYKRAFTLDGTTVQSVHFIDQRDQFNSAGEVVGISHDYNFRIQR